MNWLKKPITRIISINLIGIFLFSQVSWVYRLDFASFLPILSYQRIESAPASSGFKELSKKIANFLIPSAYAADEDDLLNKYLQEGGVRIDVIPGALNPEFDRTDWLKGNGLISEGEVSEDGAEDYQVAEEGDSGSGEADEGENASFIKEFIAALKEALINIFGDKVEITVENIDKNVDGSSGYDADTDADTVTVLITDLDKGNIIVVTIKIIAGAEEADDNENDGLFILGDGEGNPNEGVQTPEGGSETPLVTQVNVAVLKALQQIDKTGIDADTLRQVFLEAYNQFMAQQGEASSSPDNEGIDPLINPDGLGDDSGLGVTDFKQLLEDNIEQFIDIFTNVLNDTLGANNIVIVNLGGEDPSALFGQDGQGSPEGAGPAGEGLILTVTGDGKYIFFGDDPTSKQILELVSNLMNNDGKLPKDGLMEVLEGLEFPAIEFEGQDQNQDNNNGFTDYDTGDTVFVIYVDNMMDLYGEDKTPVPEGAELNNHAPPRIKLTFDGLTIIIIFNQSSQTTTPNGDETTPTGLNYPGAGLAKANNNADIEVTDQDNSNLGHNNGPPEIPQEVAAYNNPVLNDLWLLYQQANPDATPDEFLSKVSEFLNNNGQFESIVELYNATVSLGLANCATVDLYVAYMLANPSADSQEAWLKVVEASYKYIDNEGNISMEHLLVIAQQLGLDFSAGAEFTFDQLANLVNNHGPVIVYVEVEGHRHWVLVTGVAEDGTVTYINNGVEKTCSRDEFNKMMDVHGTGMGRGVVGAGVQEGVDVNRFLNQSEMANIKGSWFWVVIIIIAVGVGVGCATSEEFREVVGIVATIVLVAAVSVATMGLATGLLIGAITTVLCAAMFEDFRESTIGQIMLAVAAVVLTPFVGTLLCALGGALMSLGASLVATGLGLIATGTVLGIVAGAVLVALGAVIWTLGWVLMTIGQAMGGENPWENTPKSPWDTVGKTPEEAAKKWAGKKAFEETGKTAFRKALQESSQRVFYEGLKAAGMDPEDAAFFSTILSYGISYGASAALSPKNAYTNGELFGIGFGDSTYHRFVEAFLEQGIKSYLRQELGKAFNDWLAYQIEHNEDFKWLKDNELMRYVVVPTLMSMAADLIVELGWQELIVNYLLEGNSDFSWKDLGRFFFDLAIKGLKEGSWRYANYMAGKDLSLAIYRFFSNKYNKYGFRESVDVTIEGEKEGDDTSFWWNLGAYILGNALDWGRDFTWGYANDDYYINPFNSDLQGGFLYDFICNGIIDPWADNMLGYDSNTGTIFGDNYKHNSDTFYIREGRREPGERVLTYAGRFGYTEFDLNDPNKGGFENVQFDINSNLGGAEVNWQMLGQQGAGWSTDWETHGDMYNFNSEIQKFWDGYSDTDFSDSANYQNFLEALEDTFPENHQQVFDILKLQIDLKLFMDFNGYDMVSLQDPDKYKEFEQGVRKEFPQTCESILAGFKAQIEFRKLVNEYVNRDLTDPKVYDEFVEVLGKKFPKARDGVLKQLQPGIDLKRFMNTWEEINGSISSDNEAAFLEALRQEFPENYEDMLEMYKGGQAQIDYNKLFEKYRGTDLTQHPEMINEFLRDLQLFKEKYPDANLTIPGMLPR